MICHVICFHFLTEQQSLVILTHRNQGGKSYPRPIQEAAEKEVAEQLTAENSPLKALVTDFLASLRDQPAPSALVPHPVRHNRNDWCWGASGWVYNGDFEGRPTAKTHTPLGTLSFFKPIFPLLLALAVFAKDKTTTGSKYLWQRVLSVLDLAMQNGVKWPTLQVPADAKGALTGILRNTDTEIKCVPQQDLEKFVVPEECMYKTLLG